MATQGQWSGDWSGDWFGADGAAPTQAAPRGLLAFWAGGAVAGIAPETSAGVRSLLAPWVGGASVTPTAYQVGVRSLLAFWLGGACPGPDDEPQPEPQPIPQAPSGRPMRFRIPRRLRGEDEEIMLIIHAALQVINKH